MPDSVLLLDNVPHDWLLPRCCAVLHHGGAGTTAAGTLLCCAVPCRAVPCRAVPCVLCCAVLCCAVLCCAVLCCAMHSADSALFCLRGPWAMLGESAIALTAIVDILSCSNSLHLQSLVEIAVLRSDAAVLQCNIPPCPAPLVWPVSYAVLCS